MRLIDADELREAWLEWNPYEIIEANMVLESIDWAETIDAVEVVRCKDCKYRDAEQCAMSFRDLYTGKLFSRESDIDFCSKGERREP